MLSPKIVVRESAIAGRGLFAREPLEKNEFVWEAEPTESRYTLEEVLSWSPEIQAFFWLLAYRVDSDVFSGPRRPEEVEEADFMNHSCDPSAWYTRPGYMVATRRLAVGDEITYDYATTGTQPGASFPCACGAANCRGTVREDDMLVLPELQARYHGHVLDHKRTPVAL